MTTHCQCDICIELAASIPVEAAQESLQIMQDMKDAREDNRTLQDVDHFHNFGHDQRCACGLTEIEYIYRERDDDIELMCPLARAQYVESPAEFSAYLTSKWAAKDKIDNRRKGYRSGGSHAFDRDTSPTISDSLKAYGRAYSVSVMSHSKPDLSYMYRDNYADSFENAIRLYEQGEEFEK